MRRIALALSVSLLCLAPALAGAELLCQHKRSHRLIRADACPRKYDAVMDLGAQTSATADLDARITKLEQTPQPQVRTANLAAGAVTREKIADDAVDGTKIENGTLGLEELAVSLVLPYPARASGNNWRVVAAALDLSDADGDPVSVESQLVEPWLSLASTDDGETSATFQITSGVFSGPPLCLASLSQAGSPDAAQGLETAVVPPAAPAAAKVTVRVVGTDRRFNVRGTLLCIGVAGAS